MRRTVPAVLALAAALTACSGAPAELAGDAAARATLPAVAPAADAAPVPALWWTAPTLDGGTLVAGDLAGRRVALWLWAPWCAVCTAEAPEVARALPDLPDDVTVVGVAGRDDVEAMRAFVAEHGLDAVTHVVDADGAVWASYGVAYQPAWVFIDTDGTTRVAAGALGRDGLLTAVAEAFAG